MHARSGAMSEPQRDDHGVLGTALIFDDAVYCSEALHLPINRTEDDLEADLALLARESGIEDPYQFLCPAKDISRALSTVTLDSDPRSSMSIHSQETQSTSLTSAHSRTSRDHVCGSERIPAQRTPPRPVQTSPTAEEQNQSMEVSRSPIEPSRASSSTLSVSQSALSGSSSSSNSAPRKRRTSGLFGMFRKDSSSCTSQSHRGYHGKARGPKLECGHSLSTPAIRVHIQEARQRGGTGVPSCCGKPLPRHVLEVVLAKEEVDLVINTPLQSPETKPIGEISSPQIKTSAPDLSRPLEATPQPATSTSLPTNPSRRRHEAISINSALANEAFKTFRLQEKEQFERISAFESTQRKALSARHTTLLSTLATHHTTTKHLKQTQHTHTLTTLEETHILAEHDLRTTHTLELQNAATALKHMQAYCLATHHPHPVTQHDFRTLDAHRAVQASLPGKHANAINVLRARQERDVRMWVERFEGEVELLDGCHATALEAVHDAYTRDVERLHTLVRARRKRLLMRWDLRFVMWRVEWEGVHGKVDVEIEHEGWPCSAGDSVTMGVEDGDVPEGSRLRVYVVGA